VDLLPAVDLRGGRAVRLLQGDFARETVYGDDPVAIAKGFETAGAPWVHVVDLDAARTGSPVNRDVVAAIAAAVGVPVQAGGGVRSIDAASALVDAGVARVVVGTAALSDPALVPALVERGVRVALGLDVRGREVAVRGWTEGSGADVLDVLRRFEDVGLEAVVVTQIARDGTLEGPDVEGLSSVLGATLVPVVASGGVGTLDDVRALASVEVGGRRLAGLVVGKAIYEGRFTVEEGVAACAASA
jgi:phosphoribosylformimino-5-aminoimidazole carboxamide ribotide isomerase